MGSPVPFFPHRPIARTPRGSVSNVCQGHRHTSQTSDVDGMSGNQRESPAETPVRHRSSHMWHTADRRCSSLNHPPPRPQKPHQHMGNVHVGEPKERFFLIKLTPKLAVDQRILSSHAHDYPSEVATTVSITRPRGQCNSIHLPSLPYRPATQQGGTSRGWCSLHQENLSSGTALCSPPQICGVTWGLSVKTSCFPAVTVTLRTPCPRLMTVPSHRHDGGSPPPCRKPLLGPAPCLLPV